MSDQNVKSVWWAYTWRSLVIFYVMSAVAVVTLILFAKVAGLDKDVLKMPAILLVCLLPFASSYVTFWLLTRFGYKGAVVKIEDGFNA